MLHPFSTETACIGRWYMQAEEEPIREVED